MPKASAPNAPWVEVWLSPQTIVMPGCVSPSSGPITWTMPSRPLPVAKSRTPNSSQLRRSASSCARASGSVIGPSSRRHVVVHRRDGQLGPAHRAAGERAAPRTPAGSSPRARDAGRRRAATAPLGAVGDDVRIPDLAEQRPRAHCVRSAAYEPKTRSSRVIPRSSSSAGRTCGVEHVTVEHDVEAVAPRRVRQRARHELHEVDAVARERPKRAEERARLVVGDERDRRAPAVTAGDLRVRRDRDEARECPGAGRRRRRRSRSARTRRAASGLAIATCVGSPVSETWRAASAVVAAGTHLTFQSEQARGTGRTLRGATAPTSPARASRRRSPSTAVPDRQASPRARSRAARGRAGRASRRSGRSASSRSAARRA